MSFPLVMIRGKKEHNRPTRERKGSVLHSFPRIAAMIDGLDPVYRVPESRPVWKTRPIARGLTLFRRISLTLVAVALMVEGTHLGTWLTGRFDLDPALIAVWRYLRWGIALAFSVLAIELLYHFGPDLKQRFRSSLPEALVAWSTRARIFSGFLSRVSQNGSTTHSFKTTPRLPPFLRTEFHILNCEIFCLLE